MTYRTQAERSAWKRDWRSRQGPEYARRANEKTKQYLATFWGWMHNKAGMLNAACRWRKHEGVVSGKELIELWARQNGYNLDLVPCAVCRQPTEEWTFDHVVPLSKGGAHSIDNLQILCEPCHRTKTRKDVSKPWPQQQVVELGLPGMEVTP